MRRKPPESMSVLLPDGRSLDMAIQPPDAAGWADVTLKEPLNPRFFDRCPICGDPATSADHVPPERLGGRIMTRTCEPCNNRLGSHVEADLIDWFEDAITLPYFSSDAVRGRRRSGRILLRTTPEGEFGLIIDGPSHPEIAAMLASGEVDLEGCLPDRNRYMIALLKSAYLAACVRFGILDEVADQVRRDLLAARDASSRETVPTSALALGLTVARLYGPAPAALHSPVVRAVLHDDGGSVEGVLLAGRIFVSWSSTLGVEASASSRRLVRRFQLGMPGNGTVTSVNP